MAKAPRFRLATLERLREKDVENAATRLHRSMAQLQEAQALMDSLRDKLRASSPTGFTSADALMMGATHRELLREQIRSGESVITRMEQALDQARQAWLHAKAQLKAVNGLHDRFREGRRTAMFRAEQREIDELAGSPRRGMGR